VVVDHVTRSTGPGPGAADTFERHAEHHARVLRSLGPDAHVGEVEGEYCPGEFSINVGGRVKVVGSAQRITTTGALFSTVVQVVMSERVREVIVEVSGALGYALRESSIGGLADAEPELTPEGVAGGSRPRARRRLHTTDAVIDPDLVALAASAATTPPAGLPFDVDAWARVATTSS
jgi:octanoyl-[GcvH]:protein N-octanoyltransferase